MGEDNEYGIVKSGGRGFRSLQKPLGHTDGVAVTVVLLVRAGEDWFSPLTARVLCGIVDHYPVVTLRVKKSMYYVRNIKQAEAARAPQREETPLSGS